MPLKHLVRLLTLLALLLAPAGMLGSHIAMAAPQAAGAAGGGHCAEEGMSHEAPGGEKPKQSIDCFIACSCVPALGAQLAERTLVAELPASGAPNAMGSGLNPQADPPPPRIS